MLSAALIAALREIYPDITAEEIAEMLWFARAIEKRGAAHAEAQSRATAPTLPHEQPQQPQANPQATASRSSASRRAPVAPTGHPPAQRGGELRAWRPGSAQGMAPMAMGLLPFKTPATAALPASLEMGRAFRAFRRRAPSRTRQRVDVRATTRQIAEQNGQLLRPVLRPELRRWFDIFLVVDSSPSMDLWWQTVTEWRKLVQMIGAFRTVRVWSFTTRGAELVLTPGQKWSQDFQSSPDLRGVELPLTPSRETLVLVVTDCVSLAWHSGIVAERMAAWGKLAPVALLNVLPRRLWHRTALGRLDEGTVITPAAGAPNIRYTFIPSERIADDAPVALAGIAIPVVSLEPSALQFWAQAMTAQGHSLVSGYVFPRMQRIIGQDTARLASAVDASESASESDSAQALASPRELVRRFTAHASPLARRLLSLLAAAPISLPVVRLIQRALVPDARQSHIAEVLLSGLIERLPAQQSAGSPEEVRYDFVPGVRSFLLNSLPASQAGAVLEQVSNYVNRQSGKAVDFRAWLSGATSDAGVLPAAHDPAFAVVAEEVLRRLGGHYARLADQLVSGSPGDAIEVTDPTFQTTVLQAESPVILMVWASSNPQSLGLLPVFDALAQEYQGHILFAKLNADENPAAMALLGLRATVGVRSSRIPIMLTFAHGSELKREVGVTRAETLKKYVEDPLAPHTPSPHTPLSASFGEYLRRFRERLGMTQDNLAAACGRSASYISMLEHDQAHPTQGLIATLSAALGLSTEEERQLGDAAFDDRLSFADLLRKYRKRSGMTQRQLAQETGMKLATIRRLEDGRRPPNNYQNVVSRIARALSLSPKEADRLKAAARVQRGDTPPAGY